MLPPELAPLKDDDPRSVGPYRLVGRIGAGGMGSVYGALDAYGRCVAVKTVHAELSRRPEFRGAFAREIAMLARADGVSTTRIHGHDVETEVPWLAFDYVPGRDLRAHIREFGPLDGEMLRVFALGVAEGLAALHTAGVAHRDIKPGNIILAPGGPKIVDFGIAAPIGAERSQDPAATYGTPGWVAPERYEGVGADPGADVFAWGGVVAMASTGGSPFGAGDATELSRRVRLGEHDLEGVPADLRALVEASLSVDPGRRPSADGLVQALVPRGYDGEPQRTPAEALRGLLRDYWRGVDDAGHDPGRWAAALGATSAAGLAVSASVGGAGAAGTGGGAASVGATAGGSAGGFFSGLAGSKFVASSAGALAVAGAVGGGYAVYDQVHVSPEEAVTAAVSVLEEDEGFTASVERVPGDGGPAVTEEYLYSAAEESFLVRGDVLGEGTLAAANHGGELYVYGPYQDPEVEGWDYAAEQIEPGVDAGTLGPGLVTEPLESMAAGEEIEADTDAAESGHTVYSGPVTAPLIVDGDLVEADLDGSVELDADQSPVRASYTSDDWEVTVDLTGVGSPVEVLDPQVSDGWSVVHGPVCGRLEGFSLRTWDVRADAWEMDCEEAMEVVDMVFGGETMGDPSRTELLPGYSGSGVSTHLVDGAFTCRSMRVYHDQEFAEGHDIRPYPCRNAESTGEEVWEDQAEYDFDDAHLIDFIEVP